MEAGRGRSRGRATLRDQMATMDMAGDWEVSGTFKENMRILLQKSRQSRIQVLGQKMVGKPCLVVSRSASSQWSA